jgi:hypothetical protein
MAKAAAIWSQRLQYPDNHFLPCDELSEFMSDLGEAVGLWGSILAQLSLILKSSSVIIEKLQLPVVNDKVHFVHVMLALIRGFHSGQDNDQLL